MIIKILLAISIYIAILAVICVFLKQATKLGNLYDERVEAEILLKKLNEKKEK